MDLKLLAVFVILLLFLKSSWSFLTVLVYVCVANDFFPTHELILL